MLVCVWERACTLTSAAFVISQNAEKVWIAEQKTEAEQKKLAEFQKQLAGAGRSGARGMAHALS